MKNLLLLLFSTALLAACAQDSDPESGAETQDPATLSADEAGSSESPSAIGDEAGSGSQLSVEELAQDPEALREAMRDPEQRDALRAAMRERRAARLAERGGGRESPEREAVRERMRERRAEMMAERGEAGEDPIEQRRQRMLERSRWWSDEDLSASIGLAEAQSEALTQAQLQVEDQRRSLRQQLGQQQQGLMEAVQQGDRSAILALIEQRSMTQQSLQELELEWWRSMLNELSDEQLAALAEQNPRALIRPGAR